MEGSVLPVVMMGMVWVTHYLHKRGKAAGNTAMSLTAELGEIMESLIKDRARTVIV